MKLIWMHVKQMGNLGWIEILPHNPERCFCRDHLRSFRHALCMPAQCLIEKVANNFVSVWSDDCPTIETKCDVISSSAPCSCFRVMNISACPTLVYSCCAHCVSKTVCQSTMLAHGLNILYSSQRQGRQYPDTSTTLGVALWAATSYDFSHG